VVHVSRVEQAAPVSETIPTRLFTKDNIGSIQVTTAAQASGTWSATTPSRAGSRGCGA